jgi:orotidine-5'-phosphate decarboxylase
MAFIDTLLEIQHRHNSLLCVGLDTDPARIPVSLQKSEDPVLEFNRRIIEATSDLVCAYKLNVAFYEAMGSEGWQALHRTLDLIPKGIVVIGDAKRGDIGNTSQMYAKSLFEDFGFTATTASPYMGEDSVAPFLTDAERGTFVLAVTSNPGAKDFQHLRINGTPLYEHVVKKVSRWNKNRNCGLVVGATRPAALKRIRALAPSLPILIPGIGAQGGDLTSAIRHGSSAKGDLAVINASRSILYASNKDDFADAARKEASLLRDTINNVREKYFG